MKNKGFTIIEMLITTGVFALVTSMVLANYPKFSERLTLEQTAQKIALSFREAKIISLTVGESETGTEIFPGYGVHFDAGGSGDNKRYLIFSDLNADKKYAAADDGEKDIFRIQSSAFISGACFGEENDESLSQCGSANQTGILDVVFTRPKPTIDFYDGSRSQWRGEQNVSIFVVNPEGDVKKIIIWKTGQIMVK
ncbi:MAG: type II secretion system protein [Patescibacteria group bacterium]